MMPLRIAFMGASGTGKTTMAKHVAERFNLPVNPVGSRSLASELGLDTPYDVDRIGIRRWFQTLLLTKKRAWEAGNEAFVTDRTHIDNLVYSLMHGGYELTKELLPDAISGMRRYTHLFYCPMSAHWQLDTDQSRHPEKAYHEAFECLLEHFTGVFQRNCIEHKIVIELWPATLETRIEIIDTVLKG